MEPTQIHAAMTEALKKGFEQTGPGAQVATLAHHVLNNLSLNGLEMASVLDRALPRNVQGAIELKEVLDTFIEQGFSRKEAIKLIQVILVTQVRAS